MLDGAPVMMRPGLHVGNLGGVLSLGMDLGSIICQTCVTMSGSLRKSLESLPNFSLNAGSETTNRFLAQELPISTSQPVMLRGFPAAGSWNWEEIWKIREECITALSE